MTQIINPFRRDLLTYLDVGYAHLFWHMYGTWDNEQKLIHCHKMMDELIALVGREELIGLLTALEAIDKRIDERMRDEQ